MNISGILLLICMILSFLGLLIFVEINEWSQYREFETIPADSKEQNIYNASALISSALSAITKSSVIIYHDYLKYNNSDSNINELDFDTLFKSYLVGGIVANTKSNILPIRQNSFSVVVQTLVGQRIRISDLSCNITIRELKKKIQKNVKFAPYNQRLVFNGQELSNIASLGSYEISMNSIIYMEIKPHDSYNKVKFIILDLIDPEYQFYFNKYVNDVIIISKDFLLTQGWKQVLLKVPNKQITINNEKINDLPEVGKKKWKISYHGTAKYLHRSIAEDGYLSGKKYQQFNFSHGIYTTPNIEIASLYAKTFTYNGVKFKVLFQNLVNTNTLGRIRTYSGEYWVSPSENDIRPFGFLVKKVDFL